MTVGYRVPVHRFVAPEIVMEPETSISLEHL